MKTQTKIINELLKIAEDVVPVSRAKLCAAIVVKNNIVSIGINQRKTHPMQAEFAKNEHACYLHAEIDAITKAKRRINKEDFKKATLYVVRVKRINQGSYFPALAKPCSGCQEAIREYGIKRVIYTENP